MSAIRAWPSTGLEEKLKELLAASRRRQAPRALKARLRDQIRLAVLEQAEVTIERGPRRTSIGCAAPGWNAGAER